LSVFASYDVQRESNNFVSTFRLGESSSLFGRNFQSIFFFSRSHFSVRSIRLPSRRTPSFTVKINFSIYSVSSHRQMAIEADMGANTRVVT